MKKIVATFMSIVMMLAILVPSALAQTESQFYDQWYEDTSWKLAKCYYNWNSTGCLGCAGINEEFITAYEYYKSVYPNSKYLAQYTNLYNSTVANKAMYDAMDPRFHGVQAAPIHPEMPALAWPNLLAINLLNLNEMDHLRSERGSHQITLCISS